MPNMDVWDWVLLVAGSFVAVTTLVSLMRRRRDEVLAELSAEAEAARQKKRLEDLRDAKRKRAKRAA